MSNSQTPSPAAATPNGNRPPPPRRRRPPPPNPLLPIKRPTATPASQPGQNGPVHNGSGSKSNPSNKAPTSKQNPTSQKPPQPKPAEPEEEYEEFPVFTTKRELLKGLRHHVMRLIPNSSNQGVNPTDESQFIRPVRLHRRDPLADSGAWSDKGQMSEGESKAKIADDKERERQEILKAEKKAEREANLAQIAPTVKKVPKRKQNQKKTEMVYQFSDTAAKTKKAKIRYEEALPWHLEDFDSSQLWTGSYEAALSETHVLLRKQPDGSFQMVPMEKWYRFTPRRFNPKSQYKPRTAEEMQAEMNRRMKEPGWLREAQMEEDRIKKEQSASAAKLFTRKGERGEKPARRGGEDDERPEAAEDADDIDYDYNEAFADDEENPIFGGDDEENKQAEQKLMKERREANVFDLKEEKDYDAEEEEEKRKAEEYKKLSKQVQKSLMKREKNFLYEDDSDKNPYESESESEDSEEDEQEASRNKDNNEQNQSSDKGKANANDKSVSGASTNRTSTPIPRNKAEDPKKNKLKRPASPEYSEASGNESTRKKLKKSHALGKASTAGTNGVSSSRQSSPAPGGTLPSKPVSSGKRKAADSPAGSGSEDSEGVKKKKKVKGTDKPNSKAGSPNGSRAGSPANGSAPPKSYVVPSVEELKRHLPPEGLDVNSFAAKFGPKIARDEEFKMKVRSFARLDPVDKKLKAKR